MTGREKPDRDHERPDEAEVEAVESGELEPRSTSEEVQRAGEREEEALEG